MLTSIAPYSNLILAFPTDLGGIILVIYPTSSLAKESFLYPLESNAICPKLELELVTEKSPPLSVTKWEEYPIANIETNWITASLVALMW